MASPLVWSPWVTPNGGIDESKSDHDLAPNKWKAAFDVEPLPIGVRRRNGKQLQATLPNHQPVVGAIDYVLSDGTYGGILALAGDTLYEGTGASFSTIPGERTAAFTADPDLRPAMTVGQDIAFVSDGQALPAKVYDRSGTRYFENDGIAPPTATPTAVKAAGGSLDVGDWYVDYYYWNDTLGTKSNTRYQGIATLKVTTDSGNKKITITNLPGTVARSGDRATHIRISIMGPNDGGIFRFAGVAEGQVAIGTTTTTITTGANETNEPGYDDDVAPLHAIACVGANQRFIVPAATGYRVMASKLTAVAAYYESFPSLNYRDFGKGDGDYVTALAFIPPATLIVGFKNSVWALDGRRFLSADPVLISKNVGIAGPRSWIVVGRSLFFLSDSDRTKGLMYWNGQSVIPIPALDTTLKLLNTARFKLATSAHMAPGDGRFQWWLSVADDRVVVYDYALDAPTLYRHDQNIVASLTNGSASASVWLGGSAGELWQADLGTTDAGSSIEGDVTMRRNDYGEPDAPKRVRFLRAEGGASSGSTVGAEFQADIQGYPAFSGQLDFSADTGSVLGTGVLGAFVLGSSTSAVATRTPLTGVARAVQPKFSGTSPWTLRGYSVGVQLSRRKA